MKCNDCKYQQTIKRDNDNIEIYCINICIAVENIKACSNYVKQVQV